MGSEGTSSYGSLSEEAAPRRQAGTRRISRTQLRTAPAQKLEVELTRSKSRKSGRSSKSSKSSRGSKTPEMPSLKRESTLPNWEVNHPYFHIDYKYVKKKKHQSEIRNIKLDPEILSVLTDPDLMQEILNTILHPPISESIDKIIFNIDPGPLLDDLTRINNAVSVLKKAGVLAELPENINKEINIYAGKLSFSKRKMLDIILAVTGKSKFINIESKTLSDKSAAGGTRTKTRTKKRKLNRKKRRTRRC